MTEKQTSTSAKHYDNTSNNSNSMRYGRSSLGLINISETGSASSTLPTVKNSIHSSVFGTTDINSIHCGSNSYSTSTNNTTAITIPRSKNLDQYYNRYQEEVHHSHHPSSNSFLSKLHHHQQSQSKSAIMMSTADDQIEQQQQTQLSVHNSNISSEFSDYAIDALDASSLSPTLLQDVNLNAATNCFATKQAGSQQFLSNTDGSVINLITNSNVDIPSFVNSSPAIEVASNVLLYDGNSTQNSGAMWSDLGSAYGSTKNEQFALEDDYIFPIDKSEISTSCFGDLDGENFLDDIANIDVFLPSSDPGKNNSLSISDGLVTQVSSNNFHSMGPPNELLQNNIQHIQPFTEQVQATSPSSNMTHNSNSLSSILNQHQDSQTPSQLHHSSSSLYEYHNNTQNNETTKEINPSQSSLHINSCTQSLQVGHPQSQQNEMKSHNMPELLAKNFSMSPELKSFPSFYGNSLLKTDNVPISSKAVSPSSGSSGFGSYSIGNNSTASLSVGGGVPNGAVIVNNTCKQFYKLSNDSPSVPSRLSSSAPTHLGLDHIWMRREPRQHLLSTGSLAEAESFSSISTASILSPDAFDFSLEDEDDNSTDYNSDNYDDLSSDNGSDNEYDSSVIHRNSNSIHLISKGKERFFWQYNVQAKGPKGKRLVFQSKLEDPHILHEVSDPVFNTNCSVKGIKVYKHSGKARKGDGNDLTPNPKKLHNIGKEIDRLSRIINDMTPVSELPFNVRSKSRKEKNKLASRACRLKKKAQHEANKIKLFGLEIEHKRLLNAIGEIKQNLALKYTKKNLGENYNDIDCHINQVFKNGQGGLAVAGISTLFVNNILNNVKNGQHSGGLEDLKSN